MKKALRELPDKMQVKMDNNDTWDFSQLEWESTRKRWARRGELSSSVNSATNYFQKLAALKKYYLEVEPEILASHQRCPNAFYCSYPLDWSLIFTPIEEMAWQSIRCKGRVVLYPQYPALNYHLDFANPAIKVALEIDGKEYHNKERDFLRDAELRLSGWKVYRVTGSEMYRTNYKDWSDISEMYDAYDEEKIDGLRDWILHSGDGVIEAIKVIHFSHSDYRYYKNGEPDYVWNAFYEACKETLQIH